MQRNPRVPRTPGSIAWSALAAFGVIAAVVTVIAIAESYTNLLAFALAYGLAGWRAAIAPGAVDSFVIMGELLLFAAILLHWGRSAHVLGAGMAIWGFLLSVGGNVWHAHAATIADRAVSAIWPVTATAGLAGALMIVRQAMTASREQAPPPVPPSRGEPRRVVTRSEASRPGGLAAVRAAQDQALTERLLAAGQPFPAGRALAAAESITRPRAKRVLQQARAAMNGGSHD